MGRPRKKKEVDFKAAIEQLKQLEQMFETLYHSSKNAGFQAISKDIALNLKQLNNKVEIKIKLLPNEIQKA